MAITILTEPGASSIVAAYEPIVFTLTANQTTGPLGPACPVVFADIYFDGIYYQSINVTDYERVQVLAFVVYIYTFDISDKVQEFLNCNLPQLAGRLTNTGDVENKIDENYSASVQVKFRESYIDGNGITQFYGTAPIARTKYTNPVAGTGTATSNSFFALNANLRHEDNPDFSLHLQSFQDPFQTTLQLSHRPNWFPYINKIIGGGKYFIGRNDNDYISVFTGSSVPAGYYIVLNIKYKNGTTLTTSPVGPMLPGPSGAFANRVWTFDCGIPAIRGYFPNVNWNNVAEYEIIIALPFFQALRQYYYITDECEYIRLFFRSTAGGWDAINLVYTTETTTTESGMFKTIKNPGLLGKSAAGFQRLQSTQGETLALQNVQYTESDQKWLKELDASPQAFIYWPGEQGQSPTIIPVVILDTARATLKNEGRHEYVLNVKLKRANDVVPLRS